jgi:hypothetical protein
MILNTADPGKLHQKTAVFASNPKKLKRYFGINSKRFGIN